MAAHRRIDWERIEPPFRAGIKSVLQIAADYLEATGTSVSHTAINKHFKDLGVTRDLLAKVRAKAEAIVSAAMVSGKVSTETTETTARIIDDNAMVMARVQLSQRSDIQRTRKMVMTLLTELEMQTDGIDLLSELGEIMRKENESGQDKKNDLYNKVIALAGRSSTMKSLADSLKTMIGLERQAFNIADVPAPEPGADASRTVHTMTVEALLAIAAVRVVKT